MNAGAVRLAELMAELGLKQSDIAAEAGSSQPAVSGWLSARMRPDRRAAVLIHRRWGIDPLEWDELVDTGPEAA